VSFFYFLALPDLLPPDIPGRGAGPGDPQQHPVRLHGNPERDPEDGVGPHLAGKVYDLDQDQADCGGKNWRQKRKPDANIFRNRYLHLLTQVMLHAEIKPFIEKKPFVCFNVKKIVFM
jgi:hypothetical protein